MKKSLFTFIITLVSICFVYSQDPGLDDPIISPNPYTQGGSGTATFEFFCTANLNLTINQELRIQVSFVNTVHSGPPMATGTDYFTWMPLGNSTYRGTQNQNIPGLASTIYQFAVDVTGMENETGGFNVNLQGVPLNGAGNTESNDATNISAPIGPEIPLPVDFLSFTGRSIDKSHLLEWVTTTEQNNDGFDVQRSADGHRWESLGWVAGNGNTDYDIRYDFTVKDLMYGDNYYRLEQFDLDGKSEYSDVIVLEYYGEGALIQILPNPSSGNFEVVVSNPNKQDMRFKLSNSAGKVIWESEQIKGLSIWQKEFDLSQTDTYFIFGTIGKRSVSKKILITDNR